MAEVAAAYRSRTVPCGARRAARNHRLREEAAAHTGVRPRGQVRHDGVGATRAVQSRLRPLGRRRPARDRAADRLAAALSSKAEADDALIAAMAVICAALAGLTATLPVRAWWVIALPVVATATFAVCAAGTGAEEAVATLPLLYGAALLRLRTVAADVRRVRDRRPPASCPTRPRRSRSCCSARDCGSCSRWRCPPAPRPSRGGRRSTARGPPSRPRPRPDEAARCLEEHLIGGEIVGARRWPSWTRSRRRWPSGWPMPAPARRSHRGGRSGSGRAT